MKCKYCNNTYNKFCLCDGSLENLFEPFVNLMAECTQDKFIATLKKYNSESLCSEIEHSCLSLYHYGGYEYSNSDDFNKFIKEVEIGESL